MYVYVIMRKQSRKGFDFATDFVDYFLLVSFHQQFQLPVQRSLFNENYHLYKWLTSWIVA